jgi:6-phosphogluconolactonase (cycloisomerase 2 family)
MKHMMLIVLTTLSLLAIGNSSVRGRDDDDDERAVTVWSMSNDPAGNAVLVFRLADGRLTALGSVPTGGLGSGGREPDFGLGNAHALQLSRDGRLLFVVNPGSNDISVFAVSDDGLTLRDRVSSGGQQPLSITVHGNLVYVLNGGGNVGDIDNIAGFRVSDEGKLSPLSKSTRPLSAAATAPGQIQFTPDGKVLVVTEKSTNVIDTYTIDEDGRATGPLVTAADAQTPFGFDIANRNQLFISDDFNDAAGAGAMSSYTIGARGILHLVNSAIPAHESGACWVAVHKSGRFAFMSNTVVSTISTYSIDREDASVTLVRSFPSPLAPTDLTFSHDGRFLFALAPDQNLKGSPGVRAWRVNPQDGSVTPLPGVSGLPRSVDGLVAR